MLRRLTALFCWAFGVWVLLTWTLTLEQMLVGAGVAAAVAFALAPLGGVAGPWKVFEPRRLAGLARVFAVAAPRMLTANVRLAMRIWAPSRPLRSGMVIAATKERSPGGLTAVGLLTSVIVDNQLADLDVAAQRLQYHAVAVPQGDAWQVREAVNGPVEDVLAQLEGGGRRDR
jgi:multicomponent Na+:H+ antiporter subunit E